MLCDDCIKNNKCRFQQFLGLEHQIPHFDFKCEYFMATKDEKKGCAQNDLDGTD